MLARGDEYIKAAGIGDEAKSPLFRSALGRTGLLNGEAMHRIETASLRACCKAASHCLSSIVAPPQNLHASFGRKAGPSNARTPACPCAQR